MHAHEEVKAVLDALQQDSAVVDIDVELALECVVNEHTGLNVDIVILTVPVGLESDGHAIPALGVRMTETIAHALNDALSQYSGL